MKDMKKHSFIGKNSIEAMKKAKEVVGEDAFFIGSKVIQNDEGVEMHEIVVGTYEDDAEFEIEISDNQRELPTNKKSDKFTNKETKERNQELEKEVFKLKKQLIDMNSSIQNVNHFLLSNYKQHEIPLPPEFLEIENLLTDSRLDPMLHQLILNNLIKSVPGKLKNRHVLHNILNSVLLKLFSIMDTEYQKINLFCGPTGVGKTTSIAKLAASLKIKNKDLKIGVVSLDNYKVGAFKQLEAYADVLDLKLEVIEEPNQLIKAFHNLKEMDYIFIDTPGSSQYDLERIRNLESFISYHSRLNIEKTLVIPANLKFEDAKDIFVGFNMIGIDSITVTKLDETTNYGDIFSFLHFSKIPARNFGIGQNVPDDYIKANKQFLVDLLLNKKKIKHKKLQK